MPKSVVLTGAGRDRVGIVAKLTDTLYSLGCNLLDSSMTLLRGEFALILMVRLPANVSVPSLQQALLPVQEEMGFTLHVRELSDDELQEYHDAGTPYMISVYGADKPGIVSGITKIIADTNANITDVQTKYSDSGEKQTFVMMLEVTTPDNVTAENLRAALAATGRKLDVEVTVQPIEVYEL